MLVKAVKIITIAIPDDSNDTLVVIGGTAALRLTKDDVESDKVKCVRLEIGSSDPNVAIDSTDNRIKME